MSETSTCGVSRFPAPGNAGHAASERAAYLAARVLDALLREDYGGLAGRVARDADGPYLALPDGTRVPLAARGHETPTGVGGTYPGFLADHVVAGHLTLDRVLDALRWSADPRDDAAAFARECREALATLHLHDRLRPTVLPGLSRAPQRYETLAAYVDHPVYPTARCRIGLTEADLRAYAPESHPTFRLRWAGVPAERVSRHGERPPWWPSARDLGLPPDHDVLPVHPLTARLIDTVPGPSPEVVPTLSMRTVAVDARTHLKLPLPTSTLGLRNRRVIPPGTLADGALVQRLLAAVRRREGRDGVLLADEQTYGETGDPLLGYLLRRLPPEVAEARVAPVAALLAETGDRYVIEELTEDVRGFLDAYLTILFDWNVLLFTRYGIATESHQQNVSVVVTDGEAPRLLIKDNDGALIDPARAADALGPGPDPDELIDRRMLTDDPEALARVFVTITVHLCAGALVFGLAERGLLPLETGLRLVRDRLADALDAHEGSGFLRSRTLNADRLPVKAMVTAGTLVGKDRTGAADINKHYGPHGPNYLRGFRR